MSVPDVVNAMKVPGRLSIDPTSLTTGSYPWGGTAIGLHAGIRAVPHKTTYVIRGGEYGMVPVEAIECGEAWTIVARLASADPAALAKLFAGYAAGSVTGHPVLTGPSGVGAVVSTRKAALLFTPFDQDNQPCVLFYAALPLLTEDGEIPFDKSERWGLPCVWHASLDASKRLYQVGRRWDLTL
jgi:hypothetical protein